MAILNNNPLVGASGNQGGYNINNSLRFRASASAYLNRTPPSTGNNITWTYSGWVKRGKLGSSQDIFGAGDLSTIGNFINFTTSDTVDIYYYNSGYVWRFVTTQVFRDPSAWYHIVVAYDATQATNTNRLKLYVNGVQVTAFSTATYPALNQTVPINSGAIVHYISDTANYFDGYLSEVNFIDGSAKTPSDFGETDITTGVWKPKAYTGTYGTNGFYLKFSDIATTSGSNAGLGKDFSGNSNYWTTNNISVTAGTTYDAMKDSPTNTSATVANYPTLNPLIRPYSANTDIISAGNLKASSISGPSGSQGATMAFTSGKYYYEATATTVSGANKTWIGVCNNLTYYSLGTFTSAFVRDYGYSYASDGKSYSNATPSGTTYGATYTSGDVIGVAIDADAGTITFYKNGTSQGTAFTGMSYTGGYVFGCTEDNSNVVDFNFGQRPFAYSVPSGYVALNTYNLPTPTILQGNKYMDATTYTGNGSSGKAVTNAASFKPDLVWIKDRSAANYHILTDSVRGVGLALYSNGTFTESAFNAQTLQSFNTNGFTVGSNGDVNTNTNSLVGWQWQAGQGSTSSNTSGSITSTVSVNATAGFSVVTYAGNSTSSATVGHGLGVSPSMVIIKNRSSVTNWVVRHSSLSSTQNVSLNTTDAAYTVSSGTANGGVGAFTSTTFGFISGTTGLLASNQTSNNYVAYCFAEIAGFSKFTSYTGNGSSDGPFVYLGFRPKFIMIKSSAGVADDWSITDTSRSTYNLSAASLRPNTSGAEDTNVGTTRANIDILSNGFKIRQPSDIININTGTYIVAAWAENPFKNSLAR